MSRYTPIALALLLLALGCRPDRATGVSLSAEGTLTEAEKGHVLARIGEQIITLEGFEAQLSALSPFIRARYSSLARKRELLDGLVELALLAQEATAAGLMEDPEVKLAYQQAMVRRLLRDEVAGVSMAALSEADIAAYYEAHREALRAPPEISFIEARFASEGEAGAALIALQVAAQMPPGLRREAFAALAEAYPAAGPTPEVITEAAAALEVGAISAPIPVRDGASLLLRGPARPARLRPLDEVRALIRSRLARQRRQAAAEALVASLRAAVELDINEAALAAAPLRAPSAQPEEK
ncbi:peptidyl-prolyl cis-trans isomerase [Myxococcota bacterium]|nr:peptidyl-prolyl cis-trans isomerase [Myxococcota bacterium]